MARAFKVPVPKSYNNVTEAKLVQKGNNVWVQLPANLVTDSRMSRKSVYMDDYSSRPFHKYRNVKPKIVTRRSSYPQLQKEFSYPRDHLIPGYSDTIGGGLTSESELNLRSSRKFGEPSDSFYEGMSKGKYYDSMKYKSSEPIQAFLPVMSGSGNRSGGVRMSTHYADSPAFETTRKLSTSRSYNDKARDALPGLGGGDGETSCKIGTIEGENFLENPLQRPDLVNYEVKRSVAIHSPVQRSYSRARLDHSDPTNVDLEPYSSFENSAKRHEVEILTKVNPSNVNLGEPSLDHLYQPSGYARSSGYRVMAPAYEHGNSTFSHTGSDMRGSFTVAPDWVSERKKSVVVRH